MADALSPDLAKVDPADAWKPWQPAAGEWNRKWVAHLFRRAGFGASALSGGVPGHHLFPTYQIRAGSLVRVP